MRQSAAVKHFRMQNATKLRIFLGLCLSLFMVLLFSCREKNEKQSYSEVQGFDSPVKQEEIKVPADLPADPHAGMQMPDGQNPPAGMVPAHPAGTLTWKLPPGWTAQPGSGMFYAMLTTGPDANAGQVSIIVLPGEAGGLPANVERWLGQLGLQLPGSAVQNFIAQSKKIRTQGNMDLTLLDFSSVVPGPGNSMLMGITKPGDDSYFIKMMGPKAALESQKKNFLDFCSSLVLK